MYRYFGLFFILGLVYSCGKDCDQEFFFVDLSPSYSLDNECIELGESFTLSLNYTDTLRAFSGVILTEFDTIYRPDDTTVVSSDFKEIKLVDIKNYQFVTSLTFNRLSDTISNIDFHPNDLSSFDIVVNKGEVATGSFSEEVFSSYLPDRSNSVSNLELTITPNDTGSFFISLVHGNAGIYEDAIIADGCDDLILANYGNSGVVNESVLWSATDSSHVAEEDLEKIVDIKALLFFKVVPSGSTSCL